MRAETHHRHEVRESDECPKIAGRSDHVKVMVVDDHELVREGLKATLGATERLTIIGAVPTGDMALRLAHLLTLDMALVDLRLPDMRGDELCRRLLEDSPAMSVVVLSGYLSEETVQRSLRAGAAAYVTKSAGIGKLTEVLDRIRAAPGQRFGAYCSSQPIKRLDRVVNERNARLRTTSTDERILELAAGGMTNREIGDRLCISESTVRAHIRKLKEQLDARTRAELIAKAIRCAVLMPGREDEVVVCSP
jgi:DNA-binding NarL/FixJ family response regulator